MKPGNESLLFSWSARLVAMDPEAKIGLWLFREVGDGFSELYVALSTVLPLGQGWDWNQPLLFSPQVGMVLPSFRWAPRGQEILPLPWDTSDAAPLLLPAPAAAQGQREQGEQRQMFLQSHSAVGTPCLQGRDSAWGGLGPHTATAQSRTSPLTASAEKQRELLHLMKKSDSGWGALHGPGCSGESHWRVSLSCASV